MAVSRWIVLLIVAAAAVINAVQGDQLPVPDHNPTPQLTCNNEAPPHAAGNRPWSPMPYCLCLSNACVSDKSTSREDVVCRECKRWCGKASGSAELATTHRLMKFRRHHCAFKRRGTAIAL